ncbi:MAG TPA: SagB/ThcOx family dehydrogenase, partial [Vicinamibacterales bacterium]|nr:SagB/ThcOx family dehydrogenase [Vicinamibacterales bacterium]
MQKLNDPSAVIHYHDATKHHFHRFARSLGYLDWASQPKPFRRFEGAPVVRLPPDPAAGATPPPTIQRTRETYDRLFASSHESPQPLTRATLGEFLRYSLGLSAWKAFRDTRWSLRVNPSSGNLHPTEAYVICSAIDGLAASPAVWHYAADRHVLERRCSFDVAPRGPGEAQPLVVALTSIHWREAWKYGERAFRYCQHDIGHAIAALGIAAALHGWRIELAADWPRADIAALVGCDRDEDFFEAEREDAGCLLLVDTAANGEAGGFEAIERWTRSARSAVSGGVWTGRASQLSEDHVQWTIIDEVADATGKRQDTEHVRHSDHQPRASGRLLSSSSRLLNSPIDRHIDARTLILQRRSAVAFDGISRCSR